MPFDAIHHDEPCLQFNRPLNGMWSDSESVRKSAVNDWLDQVGECAAKSAPRGTAVSDTAVASTAVAQARMFLRGVYGKAPRDTPWSSGLIIPIDDSMPPGVDELAFETGGAYAPDIDDGIVADDAQPQINVELGKELVVQRARNVKHRFTMGMQDILRSQVTGYNKLEATWMKTAELHLKQLNDILRRGNSKHGLHGVSSFPGIRRRIVSTNWYTGTAENIYADMVSAVAEFDGSADHDAAPSMLVHDGLAHRRFKTADKVLANGIVKLADDVERSFDLRIMQDKSLKDTGTSTQVALLLTPDRRYIQFHCPMYMYLSNPHALEGGGFAWQMTTRTFGATVIDADTIMAVEGAWA